MFFLFRELLPLWSRLDLFPLLGPSYMKYPLIPSSSSPRVTILFLGHLVRPFPSSKTYYTLELISVFIHSFIQAISIAPPLLLRGAPDTARILYGSFTPKRHRELRVKNLPKVPTWRPERDSNPRPFRRKPPNLPVSHHAHSSLLSSYLHLSLCQFV